jgi:hypothetical protein
MTSIKSRPQAAAEGKRQGITAASVVRSLIDAARKGRP